MVFYQHSDGSFSRHQSTMLYPKSCGSLNARPAGRMGSVAGTVRGRAGARLEDNMIMRAFVGGFALAVGSVVCVCSANAAHLTPAPMPPSVAPVVSAPPVYNWSGFYIGGHIGGGFENSTWSA